MSHTYAEPGKYIVKIFGSTYTHIQYDEEDPDGENCNLISRIFDPDLPISSSVKSVDSLCRFAVRLLNVNISGASSAHVLDMYNVSALFFGCSNLINVSGFTRYAAFRYVGSMFYRCWSLKTTDFIFPNWCIFCDSTFFECSELIASIQAILPQGTAGAGFVSNYIGMTRTLYGCSKLTGTIPNGMLWDNPLIKFNIADSETATAKTFKNASEEIRLQVPDNWGGLIPTNSAIQNA